ncbi:hypothetical protein [Flavobacterium helocola]|uniref:HTH LytTR-type domain-containing protein n=1 Tax=Flavobacterium helocola TaxID=3139139 RepID=A0ABU9I7R1_9FLAO
MVKATKQKKQAITNFILHRVFINLESYDGTYYLDGRKNTILSLSPQEVEIIKSIFLEDYRKLKM